VACGWSTALSLACALGGAYLLACVPGPPRLPAEPRASHAVLAAPAPSTPSAAATAPPVSSEPSRAPGRPGDDHFAVVAQSSAAADAAMAVLAEGGSAADAAVAGLLVSGVTEPVSSGLGGGGFALVWDAQAKRATVLDFRETAPMGIHPEHYDVRPRPASRRGVLVGVPGELAGLTELHARWGKLPLAELTRRAAELAERGFAVSHHLGRALRWNESWVVQAPACAALFAPLGRLLASGETAKNPSLGRTLGRIAAEGRAAFYQGKLATDVVESARHAGSRMTAEDLRSYRVIERTPLGIDWEGYHVLTLPPPSAGGLLLGETLGMHGRAELRALGYATGAYDHLLGETFRGAMADRVRAVGDPAFIRLDPSSLLTPDRLRARRAHIALDRTLPSAPLAFGDSGTSTLLATDAVGNVVAVSSSVNDMFGAKLFAAGGFVLNDTLADFSDRRQEQRFAAGLRPNSPKGGARPVSSMAPTIVLRDGEPVLVLGGSGGTAIGPAVTQVLLGKLVFDRPTEQAVSDLRFHTPPGGGLTLEPEADPALCADLRARGEVVELRPSYAAVGLLALEPGRGRRRLEASGDPRKGGLGKVE
jgi:gamma-glutamyltranspeptidase / glutathione hydrolase